MTAILLEGATGRRIGVGASFGPFVASFGLNDALPLRAGDGFRLVWFTCAFQIPGISAGAVKIHLNNNYGKLSISTWVELANFHSGAEVARVAVKSGSWPAIWHPMIRRGAR